MPSRRNYTFSIVQSSLDYFFAESLREMNAVRQSRGLPLVSTTQGRLMRNQFITSYWNNLTTHGIMGNNATNDAFYAKPVNGQLLELIDIMQETFNSTIAPVNGNEPFYGDADGDEISANALNESVTLPRGDSHFRAVCIMSTFTRNVGWHASAGDAPFVRRVTDNGEVVMRFPRVEFTEDSKLPISPYDPMYASRTVVLNQGGNILWADANDLVIQGENGRNIYNPATITGARTNSARVNMYTQERGNMYAPTAYLYPNRALPEFRQHMIEQSRSATLASHEFYDREAREMAPVPYTDVDDITGLSRLRPYMSDKEYQDARRIVSAGYADDGTILSANGRGVVCLDDMAIDRCVSIMSWLHDNGYKYTVGKDLYDGQLKLTVDKLGFDIRLMDVRGRNENDFVDWLTENGVSVDDPVIHTGRLPSTTTNGSRGRNGELAEVRIHPNSGNYNESRVRAWLDERGYKYTMRGGNGRDVVFDLERPSMHDNNRLCGSRIYRNGFTTMAETSGNGRPLELTGEQAVMMVQYALGLQVERTHYLSGSVETLRGGVPNQGGIHRIGDSVGQYLGESAGLADFRYENGRAFGVIYPMDGLLVPRGADTDPDLRPGSLTFADVMLQESNGKYRQRAYVIFNTESESRFSSIRFLSPVDAAEYLKEAVDTARANYLSQLNLDELIEEANAYLAAGQPEGYEPVSLSSSVEMREIQRQYWDVLIGVRPTLYKLSDDVQTQIEDIDEANDLDDSERMLLEAIGLFDGNSLEEYDGTPEEKVRAHVADVMDMRIGQFSYDVETDAEGHEHVVFGEDDRFNPSFVSSYMHASTGMFRNTDNIVAAMRELEMTSDQLLDSPGSEFANGQVVDRLIKFDPSTAVSMGDENASPFMREIAQTIVDAVRTSHCVEDSIRPEDVMIDANGVVQYHATQYLISSPDGTRTKREYSTKEVTGLIGQIFEPDGDGVIETKFAGSQNKLFSPGYTSYIVPQAEGESKTMYERMRLRGYMDVLKDNIRTQIRQDLEDLSDSVGVPTSVNNTYVGLYSETYKVRGEMLEGETMKDAYVRECHETGLPDDVIEARFKTMASRVVLPDGFKEESSLNASYVHRNDTVEEAMNDYSNDAWQLSGGENISLLSPKGDGRFDKDATGSAKNQGNVRYLVEGAVVEPDGSITPAMKQGEDGEMVVDTEAKTALMNLVCMSLSEHTPFDRRQMTFSNLLTATGVDMHCGVAYMTAGLYTFDDGAILNAKWARTYAPKREGDEVDWNRLVIGDKVAETAGNKSIVGKVIDPDMSDEEYEKATPIERAIVDFMRENPQVDVIMSPYSPASRFNATSACFAMQDNFEIKLPDGSVTYGGYMPMIITDKTVDEKTKEYDEDAVRAGGGRSASGQFNWILSARGAYGLMDECYGGNMNNVEAYREYLITMGLDMDEVGTLHVGYEPHPGEVRNLFVLPSAETIASSDVKDLKGEFKNVISAQSGFLEIPFQLSFPAPNDDQKLESVPAEQSAYGGKIPTYKLPIMSSYLRSGREFQDGSIVAHDYTNQYAAIYENSVKYIKMMMEGAPEGSNAREQKRYRSELAKCMPNAEKAFSSITSDVQHRIFETKHNFVRDHLMSCRLPNSATAVWTAEPECKIDEIRMSSKMAATLGKQEGEEVLLWRDPCLHASSLAGMRIVIDDSLKGVAINPLMAARMDGDFDGDSVGLYGVHSKEGMRDLHEHFAIQNTLLDYVHPLETPYSDSPDQQNGHQDFALFINTKMDVRSLYAREEERRVKMTPEELASAGPTFKERFSDLERRANDIYHRRGEYTGKTAEEIDAANRRLCDDVSTWTKELFESHIIGAQTLSMESPKAYFADLSHMAETKAKGKVANLVDVAKYMGIEPDSIQFETYTDHDGKEAKRIKIDSIPEFEDLTLGKSCATRQDSLDVQTATAIKSQGTGIAGQLSLNLAEVARNRCLEYVLNLTYNATQGVLQAKHDAPLAWQQYTMIQTSLQDLWRGHKQEEKRVPVYDTDADGSKHQKMNEDGSPVMKSVWVPIHDEKGRCVQCTTDEWVKQFIQIHESADGMNLAGEVDNVSMIREVAKALSDSEGFMYDVTREDVRQQLAAPMDRLAYQPSFEATVEAASNRECIYAGEANKHLAPKALQSNMRLREAVDQADRAVKIAEAQLQTFKQTGRVIVPDPTPEDSKHTLVITDEALLRSRVDAAREARARYDDVSYRVIGKSDGTYRIGQPKAMKEYEQREDYRGSRGTDVLTGGYVSPEERHMTVDVENARSLDSFGHNRQGVVAETQASVASEPATQIVSQNMESEAKSVAGFDFGKTVEPQQSGPTEKTVPDHIAEIYEKDSASKDDAQDTSESLPK